MERILFHFISYLVNVIEAHLTHIRESRSATVALNMPNLPMTMAIQSLFSFHFNRNHRSQEEYQEDQWVRIWLRTPENEPSATKIHGSINISETVFSIQMKIKQHHRIFPKNKVVHRSYRVCL